MTEGVHLSVEKRVNLAVGRSGLFKASSAEVIIRRQASLVRAYEGDAADFDRAGREVAEHAREQDRAHHSCWGSE